MMGTPFRRCYWRAAFGNLSTHTVSSYGARPSANSQFQWSIRRFKGTTTKALSRRNLATLEDYLFQHLGLGIKDPVLNSDLRSLDWIQRRIKQTDNGDIVVTLSLPSLLHPAIHELKEQTKLAADRYVQQFYTMQGWEHIPEINLVATAAKPFPSTIRRAEDHQDYIQKLGPGLAHISHFLAVYSCKGGVGKSTVAVNIAYELARMGGRIGLLDVDIYGPSLPVLIHPDDPAVRQSPIGRGMIYPIQHRGVKLMSLGYVSPTSGVPGAGGGAAVMRGPMAGKVVSQLLKGTDWGELDVLVLDLPPGTGDVPLAICQDLPLSGAIAVTTPSKLALSDARKGIEMFASLGVPTVAAVENMAYFVCEGGGRHYPFGKGSDEEGLLKDYTANVFQLPISTATNEANDSGSPLCVERPVKASDELAVFSLLSRAISKELMLVQHNRPVGDMVDATPHRVTFQAHCHVLFDVASTYLAVDKDQQGFVARFFSEDGAIELSIAASVLRSIDPRTGEVLAESGMVQQYKALLPATVERKGRYGYAIQYADKATIIYSMIAIAKAAGGVPG